MRKKNSKQAGFDFVPVNTWDEDALARFYHNAPLIYPWRLPADDEYVIELKRRGLPLNQAYFVEKKERRQ